MTNSRCILLVAVATTACLPRGGAPAGRQIVADRQIQLGPIVATDGDGLLRILILRPAADGSSLQDLFVVSVDPDGGPPSQRLLASGLDADVRPECLNSVQGCGTDARGRLWVRTNAGQSRINAITGDRLDFSFDFYIQPSQSGDRFLAEATSGTTLYDGEDLATPLDSTGYHRFFGEDLYYITTAAELMYVPPSGTAARLATSVLSFEFWPTPDGLRLLLARAATDASSGPVDPATGKVEVWSVLDPTTARETAFPFATPYVYQSPDGRWVVLPDDSNGRLTFYAYPSGPPVVADLSQPILGFLSWSVAHSEVWLNAGPYASPNGWVVKTDGTTTMLPGLVLASVATAGGTSSAVTEDGRYWFSTPVGPTDPPPQVQVGATEDPLGPRVGLNPPGTTVERLWSLSDGRLLVAARADREERSDIFAVDPRSGDSPLLAERGQMAAVGQSRFLGMFHVQGGRGDLTAVDLGTGRATILSAEFTVTAFAEPQADDAVAPGTRIAYQFQARTASPYDGLWVVNCP